eukprot:CAMPEP_0175951380 /NCGR_PEP_ID=MMETSP0108-20121206/30165_1 /TAXON_ID=195067 ORGANISM="Goniomonas pacifica, Strain CCMP1869" /NCGR_SAMPLE_ID=MMETSP0108 /ASSEMBLY_ACC=CAM_ASM_000204 /LENGTH=51 /DNA_ID=CAMNT_0017277627 /DNA_START=1 /DNA_END=153 /DNA_ORIENTATION=+
MRKKRTKRKATTERLPKVPRTQAGEEHALSAKLKMFPSAELKGDREVVLAA